MKKKSFIKLAMMFITAILVNFTNCSKDNSANQIEYLHTKLAEVENAVLLKQFNMTPLSMEIVNVSFFRKVDELKSSNNQNEKKIISSALCNYDLSTTSFCNQKKIEDVQLSDEEIILYESFIKTLANSEENSIALCEFFINEVSCLDIEDEVKQDFTERVGFFRDLLIYIDYETNNGKESYDLMLKSLRTYEDCYDDCMVSELEAIEGSTMKTIFFLLHLPFSAAELVLVCAAGCI